MALVIAAAAAVALAAMERSPRLRFRAAPFLRPWFAADVAWLLTGWVAGAGLALAYVAAASDAVGHALGLPRLEAVAASPWLVVPLAIVLLDAGNYAVHWSLHRFDFLWAIHCVHHSSRELDWLATFRSHLLEQALRWLVAPLGLIALGFPIDSVAAAGGIFTAWAVFNHANVRFGSSALERVFVTPRLHRLHHVPRTSERNLGTVLSLWDRLRGTLVLEPAAPDCVFGVPGAVESYPQGFWRQLVQPLRRPGAADATSAATAAAGS